MPSGVHFCKAPKVSGLLLAGVSAYGRMLSGFPVSVLMECRLNCLRWCDLCRLPLVLSVSARTGSGVPGGVSVASVVSVGVPGDDFRKVSGCFRDFCRVSVGFPSVVVNLSEILTGFYWCLVGDYNPL